MFRKRFTTMLCLASVFALIRTTPAEPAGKKLRVFILSGQSNMVGHASSQLLANLLVSTRADDAALAKMLIEDYEEALKTAKPKMEELQKQIDVLVERAEKARLAKVKADQDLKAKADQGLKAEDALKAAEPKVEELEEQMDALAERAEKARLAKEKARQAKEEAYQALKAEVDEVAKQKTAVLKSIQYKKGKKVRIVAFGQVHGSKSATGSPIATGFGANVDRIGPEYGFGMALEKLLDGPVLLIKVSWGGIDIDGGFRPPSSKQVGNETKPGTAPGPKYEILVKHVRDVLGDLKKHHPDYDAAAGYEVAGFFWFQGFNDQFGDKPTRYRQHMINFVRDIRAEFKAPKMRFVIGVIGTSSPDKSLDYAKVSLEEAIAAGKKRTATHTVAVAQREAAALPEFAGTVIAVESYPYYDYEIWPLFLVWKQRFAEWVNAGSDRPYHYLGSARFFARFGNACAEAMVKLVNNKE